MFLLYVIVGLFLDLFFRLFILMLFPAIFLPSVFMVPFLNIQPLTIFVPIFPAGLLLRSLAVPHR